MKDEEIVLKFYPLYSEMDDPALEYGYCLGIAKALNIEDVRDITELFIQLENQEH
jgi:hypothetical protein